jgi:hypothetical protein
LEIQDGRQGLIFDEKMTILHVDHHGGHKVGPIVFILGENIAKYKDMTHGRSDEIGNSKWPPSGFFGSFFTVKMTHLTIHHHGDCRMCPIVYIFSEYVA